MPNPFHRIPSASDQRVQMAYMTGLAPQPRAEKPLVIHRPAAKQAPKAVAAKPKPPARPTQSATDATLYRSVWGDPNEPEHHTSALVASAASTVVDDELYGLVWANTEVK